MLRAFARRFAHYGFSQDAFMPGYGMAESTVAISIGRGINAERVLRPLCTKPGAPAWRRPTKETRPCLRSWAAGVP
jgi:acyl-CoA synthetase (AMP-forming)/AMP-acid ligase II